MKPRDYFAVMPPQNSLYKDGWLYTPLSPMDQKLGTNSVAFTLRRSDGASMPLARSQRALAWQYNNFGRAQRNLEESRREALQLFGWDGIENGITHTGVLEVAEQCSILRRAFYEDERCVRLSASEFAGLRIDTGALSELLGKEVLHDPCSKIGTLFEGRRGYSPDERSLEHCANPSSPHDFLRSYADVSQGDWRVADMFKHGLLPVAMRALDGMVSREKLPSLESDILGWISGAYSGALLIHSPEKRGSWNLLMPNDDAQLILEDGQSRIGYRCVMELSELEMAVALRHAAETAIVSQIPPRIFKILGGEALDSIFPIELESARLSIMTAEELDAAGRNKPLYGRSRTADSAPGDIRLLAKIKFRPYAVVDFERPENVYLMSPGVCNIRTLLSPMGLGQYETYDLYHEDGTPYEHFFSHGGTTVCGFQAIGNYPNWLPLSNAIWENFRGVHAILTNGLKYSYGSMHTMREEYSRCEMTIGDATFTRYLPRAAIEQHNAALPAPGRIFIGDGRIK